MADVQQFNGSPITTQVAVGTAITALPTNIARNRAQVTFKNLGTSTVYIGKSDVATTTGFPLTSSDAPLSLPAHNSVFYGVTGGGSGTISVLELTQS